MANRPRKEHPRWRLLDRSSLPSLLPGSHVDVRLTARDGDAGPATLTRSYSVVASEDRERAEFYVAHLHAYGLQATLEQSEA